MSRTLAFVFLGVIPTLSCTSGPEETRRARSAPTGPASSTYSIVAVDLENGDMGVAVQSRYFGVGPVVPWVESGVGAIATQSYANTSYGPRGLESLRQGKTVEETLSALLSTDAHREWRQVGMVDARGQATVHTGKRCQYWAGSKTGKGFAVQGNILVSDATVNAMATAYESTATKELAERLMRALEAGQQAGGDVRGRQSAALRVARRGAGAGGNDRYVWLNVEDHPRPLKELRRLLERQLGRDALSRARVAQRQNELPKARQLFLEAERAEPDNALIRLERARVEIMSGKPELAEATIREAVELEPDYDNVLFQSGRLSLEAGRVDQAIGLLEKLVKINPFYRDRLEHEVESEESPFAKHAERLRTGKLLRKDEER
jgi:uncharacterized Ntn-hydrolase superfamily protein